MFDDHSKPLVRGSLKEWGLFICYVCLLVSGLFRHEMWRDELQVWNIARASGTLTELLTNIRYEGHPALWFLMIWPVTKVSTNPYLLQVVHGVLALSTAGIVIFRSPFSLLQKCGIVLSYYLLYEYSLISRNYQAGVLLLCCICLLWNKLPGSIVRIGGLLFLLFQTNAFGALLGGAFALAAWIVCIRKKPLKYVPLGLFVLLVLAGGVGALVSLPPKDSSFATAWFTEFSTARLAASIRALGTGFFPLSDLRNYHFWNASPAMMERAGSLVLVGAFVLSAVLALRKSASAVIVFGMSVFLVVLFSYLKYPGAFRHQGHASLALVFAVWLFLLEKKTGKKVLLQWVFGLFLGMQLLSAGNAYLRDFRYPFSMAEATAGFIRDEYGPEVTVCGIYSDVMTGVSGYLRRPFYHLDFQQEVSHVVWNERYWNDSTYWQPDSVIFSKFMSYHLRNPKSVLVSSYRPMKDGDVTRSEGESYWTDRRTNLSLVLRKEFKGAINRDENFYVYAVVKNK